MVLLAVTAGTVIAAAHGEVGYTEKADNASLDGKTSNSGSGNYTKYARDLAAAGYYNGNKNGYEWCDVFVDWCFFAACGRDREEAERIQCQTGPLGAGVGYSMGYYEAAGRLDKTPRPGDQVFFRYGDSGVDHTGIVTEVTAERIATVEGNSSDGVREKSYDRDYYAIIGYGHPRYEKGGDMGDMIELSELRQGMSGAEVRTLQRLLRARKWRDDGGSVLIADGEFGAKTKQALIKFQNKKKLTPDGICGIRTWTELLKG